jgi:hypothetical protein
MYHIFSKAFIPIRLLTNKAGERRPFPANPLPIKRKILPKDQAFLTTILSSFD